MRKCYKFDINTKDSIRDEMIYDCIDKSQLDVANVVDYIRTFVDVHFEVNENQKEEIIQYIDKIRKRCLYGKKVEK